MDIGDTIAPTSDQLDAVDLLAGPRTFTIERVSINNDEQPVNIYLDGFPRPWRPGKSMRRVLVSIWGRDSSAYVGRRLTLWCDPTVSFGGVDVGGTRIRAMSNIEKPRTVPLLVTRGRSAPYRVIPLTDDAPADPAVSLALRVDEAIKAFANGGVNRDQLQARVGKDVTDWTAQDVADLEVLFQSLRDRKVTKEQAFPAAATKPADVPPPSDDEPDPESANAHWAEQ